MNALDCTIIVASCDRYADLHEPFLISFRKHWPDCPWPVALLIFAVFPWTLIVRIQNRLGAGANEGKRCG